MKRTLLLVGFVSLTVTHVFAQDTTDLFTSSEALDMARLEGRLRWRW